MPEYKCPKGHVTVSEEENDTVYCSLEVQLGVDGYNLFNTVRIFTPYENGERKLLRTVCGRKTRRVDAAA